MTLRAAITRGANQLSAAGVPSSQHDAEALAALALGCDRSELWRHFDEPPPPTLDGYLDRRARREPLQHITGQAHFRHVTLAVGPGVFIPRPETEVVVDEALRLLRAMTTTTPIVVDLCSGSGAIALAIATEHPGSQVHAVECATDALPWLRRNVEGVGIEVHESDIASPIPQLAGSVDLVIANPPYIPADAVPRDLEVAQFDPTVALYSGDDGLDHIRLIERNAAQLLRDGGSVVVEHADVQGMSAPAVFADRAEWIDVVDHQDLTGRDRFLTACRSGSDRAAI